MRRLLVCAALFFIVLAPYTLLGSFQSPCWLLGSPWQEWLSGSGESALLSLCAPQYTFSAQRALARIAPATRSSPIPNIQVNDPSADIPEQTTQSETTIALYKEIVLVAFVDTGQYLPATAGVSSLSGYAHSDDGGQTFTDLGRVPPSSRSLGYSDPSLGVDRFGNFYFANIQFVPSQRSMLSFLGVAKSTDDGKTFAEPILIGGTGPAQVHFQDKELIAVDDTGGRFDGNVYMAWTEFTPDGPQILFVRSIDGGKTFSQPIALSDEISVQGATPAVGPNGEVYVVWLSLESGRSLKLRRSDDGGVTFGPPVTAASLTRTADPQASSTCRRQALRGGIRTLELPSVAVDRSPTSFFRGALYIAYQSDPDGPGPDMSDVFLVSSLDGGKTFSAPVRVNDEQTQTDQFMPAVAVAADGTVGVFFYDRRLDPRDNLKIDVYFARSRNGGRSFEPSQRITDLSFDVPPTFGQPTSSNNFDALRGICYMGDYNQMAADERFFYLAWGDHRNILKTANYPNGRPDPDVFFAKVPVQPGLEP